MVFGIYTTAELRKLGYSGKSAIRTALELGHIIRLRRGIYATPDSNAEVAEAIKLGGSIGCLKAARLIGLWVPPNTCNAILIPSHASPPHHSIPFHRSRTTSRNVFPPVQEILWQVARYHDAETAAVVMESALNLRKIYPEQVRWVLNQLPARNLRKLRYIRVDAQSGSETRVRRFLESLRVPTNAQVNIEGVGRVDILVGKSLIIECDSRTHHSQPTDYEADRRRDIRAQLRGYTVLRLSFSQIWLTWEETQQMLKQILARRDYRRVPGSSYCSSYSA